MNAKKLVSFSSTAVVFSLLHILHGVEWKQLLLKKWKLCNDLFKKNSPRSSSGMSNVFHENPCLHCRPLYRH